MDQTTIMDNLDSCIAESITDLNPSNIDTMLTHAITHLIDGYKYDLTNNPSRWLNTQESKNFDFLFYQNGEGSNEFRLMKDVTNAVIVIANKSLSKMLGFKVIDIFNDSIELCTQIGEMPITTILINDLDGIEISEGYIFQLELMHKIMPFKAEHITLLLELAKLLKPDDRNFS